MILLLKSRNKEKIIVDPPNPVDPPTVGGIPYSGLRCGDYFYKQIMFAKKSIYICSPWISASYAEQFVELARKGIKVTIITSDQKNNEETVETLTMYKNQSKFDFRIMPKLHTKMYLADNSLVVDGSANFTKTGLWNQQNNITIYNNFQDYKKFENIFFEIWDKSKN